MTPQSSTSSTTTSTTASPSAVTTAQPTQEIAPVPPIAHAIGGSIGSALSLLLLYPLERARIEMQAQATLSSRPSRRKSSNRSCTGGGIGGGDDSNSRRNRSKRSRQRGDSSGIVLAVGDCIKSTVDLNTKKEGRGDMNVAYPQSSSSSKGSESGSGSVLFDSPSMAESSFEVVSASIRNPSSLISASSSPHTSDSNESFFTLGEDKETDDNDGENYEEEVDSPSECLFTTAIFNEEDVNKVERKSEQKLSTATAPSSKPFDSAVMTPTITTTTVEQNRPTTSVSANEKICRDTPSKTDTVNRKKMTILSCLIQLQAKKELYKGVKPIVFTLALSNFVFFYTLQITKRLLKSYIERKRVLAATARRRGGLPFVPLSSTSNGAGISLLSSSLAGIANVLLTNPFWVANLRIVQGNNDNKNVVNEGCDISMDSNHVSSKKIKKVREENILVVMKDIMEKEGIAQLWNGTLASLFLVSNPAIQHFVYEQFKSEILARRSSFASSTQNLSLSSVEAFVLGALAKGFATVVTYPLQLAQVLLRLSKKMEGKESENAGGIADSSSVTDNSPTESNMRIHPESKSASGQSSSANLGDDDSASLSSRSNNTSTPVTKISRIGQPPYRGLLDCMIQLYNQGGIRALYKGMDAKLLQTVLTAAFTFLTYEQILNVVTKSYMSFVASDN